jgi:16S rRNA (uracil1498-N3)-methyltransferase
MPRFFVDLPLAAPVTLVLPEAARRHAVGVLRLRAGDALTLFNGTGGEYHGVLVSADSASASVRLERFDTREAELPFAVTVAQGLSSGDKMDWTVEKAVELGACAVQPLAVHRSVVRLSGDRAERRRAHWQAIAQAAAEQCGRNRVPEVYAIKDLDLWTAELPNDALLLYADPRAQSMLSEVVPPPVCNPVYLLVGPEGGLTETEEATLATAGFRAVSLGQRVLRTETAALAALAMLGAIWRAPA